MSELLPVPTVERLARGPLVGICLDYFMVILDVTIANVAAPAIGRDLQASVTGVQWWSTAIPSPSRAPRRPPARCSEGC